MMNNGRNGDGYYNGMDNGDRSHDRDRDRERARARPREDYRPSYSGAGSSSDTGDAPSAGRSGARPQTSGEQKRKNLSIEDKKRVIDLVDGGEPLEQVADDLGVPPSFLQYIIGNREQVLREYQFASTASSSKRPRTSSAGGDRSGSGSSSREGSSDTARPVGRGAAPPRRQVDITPLHTRPRSVQNSKQGETGRQVKFTSNHFSLKADMKWCLCKHHVDFNPPEDRTFVRRSLMRVHKDKFSGYLFDGSTLFTIRNACPDGKPLELTSERKDGTQVKITVKSVGTCEPGDYQYMQVFNIILRECLACLKLQLIRRNYYDPAAKVQIPEYKLELWPGYVTAIRQYEHSYLLNAEISFKVLRQDTAYHLFLDCKNRGGDIKSAFSQAIIGCIVLTNYNNKTYRVDEVDYKVNPLSTFETKKKGETSEITYMNYYQEKYNIRIHDQGQPMLISKSNAKDRRAGLPELVYLVPEFCVMTGLTDEMRSNHQLMRAVANHTAVGPGDRVKRLLNFSNRLNSIPEVKEKLRSWGLELERRTVEIDGRILPSEKICGGQGGTFDAGPQADWTRTLRECKLLVSVRLDNWVIIYPNRCESDARNFCDVLSRVAGGMSFFIGRPTPYGLPDDRAGSYVQAADRAINEKHPQLVLCVATNNRADRYAAIKKKCVIDKPTPSQVVLVKTITQKGLMSIATKIAIQLNCKIGGAPWSVPIPAPLLMTVGFDVCHDPKDKRRSFAGMVATLDRTCGRYFSTVSHHAAGEEVSTNFALSIMKAVERFQNANDNQLPKTIVVFRDGVGDGNLRYVYEQEVQNIKNSLNDVYNSRNLPLKLAFIIVTKKINTRIFYGSQNPPPGTIIDDVITDPTRYDFFLISQSVRQGTVSPTHYNVVEDTTGWKPDQIQRLTYKFTHLYYNWSGTVRVPAPCQYAHKLAFLTSQHLGQSHAQLSELLYFL